MNSLPAPQLTDSQFSETLEAMLGESYTPALELFHQYSEGPNGAMLSFCLTGALLAAAERGKVPEVLGILQNLWNKDLKFQAPAIRGGVGPLLSLPVGGLSHFDIAFIRIKDILLEAEMST